uniref:Uncharacterized protein n=1 Tax=Candidatus Kentrum sp. FW TaxID=2126338 RepID=A0A450T091_9GAMM|nr:MAG: hypothetical protein BECKFW1821A_GA0114235_10953 [Candidatus Kentron sp. FW]
MPMKYLVERTGHSTSGKSPHPATLLPSMSKRKDLTPFIHEFGESVRGKFMKKLEWDRYRIDHILRHNMEPEEVCHNPLHLVRRQGHNRYFV